MSCFNMSKASSSPFVVCQISLLLKKESSAVEKITTAKEKHQWDASPLSRISLLESDREVVSQLLDTLSTRND